jgi:GT2 family glycosyltransferase/glycosyltransferase involved in cell wall biosynthesis
MATKLNDLEKKSNSSRWLLKTVIKKIIHSPRDISRRWRKSWQKWCAADIPAIAAMKHPAFDLRLLRNAQYRKYASSWLVLRFERCIPRSFASRMRRRMEKHAPVRPVASPAKVWSIAPNWNLFEDLRSSAEHSLGEAAILDVIIPVYRGYDETLSCIYSVLSSRNTTPFELVVIDDSSPEPMLSEALDRLARMNLITLLRNEQNLGFVRTVNRGMSMHGSRDVLLLNSDTIVANDWLDRIRAHALLPNVASVTPFTNNGTICSYPEFCKDNPQELEVPFFQLDLMAATFNRNRFVEVPTGVGFCMYITRRALDKSGLFDAETFGRGYGEENDFCVKASKLGMRNLHALDVFVFHSGETSFGADSSRAKKNGLNALTSKYPDYLSEIAKYISADPAKEARVRLDIARMLKTEPKRLILCFTHTRGGGVERYLRDRALSVADTGEHLLLAVPNPAAPSTIRLTGVDGGLPLANLPEFDIIENENAFIELLKSLPVHVIEVHSSVGWSANLLRFVPRIASTLKIPFDFMAHDYVATCPQINLINESGIYCGERGEEQCRRCLIAAPATPHVVHPDMSDFGMDDIVTWRKNYHRFLKSARKVFAPSDDTAKRLQRYFSDISVTTHPPAENTQVHTRHVAKPYFGDILRVVVIGAIGPHKGSGILRACADDALRRDLPIHFIIVGTTNVHDLPSRRNVSITGPYSECEVFGRLAEIGAHVALLPSVWPETYCYTLSIAIAGGFPICAFDIGAPAQRLKSHPGMTLLPVSMMTDAAGINDALLRMISVGAMEALAS